MKRILFLLILFLTACTINTFDTNIKISIQPMPCEIDKFTEKVIWNDVPLYHNTLITHSIEGTKYFVNVSATPEPSRVTILILQRHVFIVIVLIRQV